MISGRMAKRFAIGAGLALAAAGASLAQTTEAVTADEIEAAMSAAGLNPSMTSDVATGAPVARGQAGEVTFWVRAFDCSGAPSACETLMFFANFELGRSLTANDFRVINSYNESQVFGRAYVIEGEAQVGVDYVIELGGGVTKAHLDRNIGRWADVVSAFMDKFRAGQGQS